MVKGFIASVLMLAMGLAGFSQPGFKETQQSYARVKNAYLEKWDPLENLLADRGLEPENIEIYIRAFKQERILEVWVKGQEESSFSLFKAYEICTTSGVPGPKRSEGDLQIPEGFYHISVFNPWSSFHLSLGINYPNRSNLGKDLKTAYDLFEIDKRLPDVTFLQDGRHGFSRLDFITGSWSGQGTGFGNNRSVIQSEFKYVMNGAYLEASNRSTFEPSDNNPDGEVHIDRGYMSFDNDRNKIVYRQFHVEGYINLFRD